MKLAVFASVFLLIPMASVCQTPSPAAAAAGSVYTGELGYSYAYPEDWEFVDTAPMREAAHQQAAQNAASDAARKGAECIQFDFMARHGVPPSMMMTLTLPFGCYGSKFTPDDLPALGENVANDIKNNFDIADAQYDAYKLGTHRIWIERAKGSVKGHPEATYTLETACTILDKGMVCLFAMANDAAALTIFERGAVTLEGEKADALVPATVFAADKKK